MSRPRFVRLAVGPVVLLALGVAAFLYLGNRGRDGAGPPGGGGAAPGFREDAREAGLTFRMAFLPAEQGEKFKINLYDHGCGVVVGDYDGDGHDDVYFLNQAGPNAL